MTATDIVRRGPRARLRATFRSLSIRNFRLFVLGQLLSGIGTWMHFVAGPWLVLELTGSGVALGIDAALTFLPVLLFGPWGGLIADRFDNRRVILVGQSCYGVLALILWALDATGVVRVWMVYAISFGMGVVTVFDMPTRQSFYLEMVGREHLTNAMSLNTATFTGTRILGGALAAVVIAAAGTAPAFLLNALSYLAVIVALMMMRRQDLRPRARLPRAKGQLREGLRYVWDTPALRTPMALMGVVFLFAWNFQVLLPLLAVRAFDGDAGTFGVLLAVFGVGSLGGALVMAGRTTSPDVTRLAVFGAASAFATIATGVSPTLPAAWVAVLLVGAGSMAFAITGNSTLQLASSEQMRGRVMALYMVLFLGSTPIGGPIAGAVAEHLGPRAAFVGAGVISLIASAWTLAVARRAAAPEPAVAAEV